LDILFYHVITRTNDYTTQFTFPRNYCTTKKGNKQLNKQTFSACNRTLYGDVGRTYRVEIRRPREDRLPFLCHLNFTAAGSDLGDLVQVGHRNDVVVENNADWCPVSMGNLSWSRQRAASHRSPANNLYPGFYDSYRVYWWN